MPRCCGCCRGEAINSLAMEIEGKMACLGDVINKIIILFQNCVTNPFQILWMQQTKQSIKLIGPKFYNTSMVDCRPVASDGTRVGLDG